MLLLMMIHRCLVRFTRMIYIPTLKPKNGRKRIKQNVIAQHNLVIAAIIIYCVVAKNFHHLHTNIFIFILLSCYYLVTKLV